MARIVLVDDHPLIRKGLAATLEAETDLSVTAQLSSAEEFIEKLDDLELDLLVVDLSLPGMSGLELLKHLQSVESDLPVLVVSRHDETLYAERVLRAGGRGYVMKLEAGEQIVQAVRRVLNGGIYVSDEVNERLLMNLAAGKEMAQSPLDALSDRELEVFELTGQGLGTREIAERLYIAVKTVESYRARIKEKLNLDSATELMQRAVNWVEESG